jgi:2,3,4,5-tetrahydropyridine-2-carboxylate N-succinyltransferase
VVSPAELDTCVVQNDDVKIDGARDHRDVGMSAAGYARRDDIRNVEIVAIRTEIGSLSSPPADVQDAYLRLHLLSHRLVEPNRLNLDGIFALLPNVVWTTLGPCEAHRMPEARMEARKRGVMLEITGIDKFPRLTDYVVRPTSGLRTRTG